MKLIKKLTLALTATAAVFAFASCGSTSSTAAAPKADAAPAAPAVVGTVWEWASIPFCDIGTSDTIIDPTDPVVLKAKSGSDATFKAAEGKAKFKTEDLGTALYHGNKSSASLETLKENFVAKYVLSVTKPSKVVLTISGNGDATPARCMAVYNAADAVLASVDNLGQDAKSTLEFEAAEAGDYTILLAGMRIYGVNVQDK